MDTEIAVNKTLWQTPVLTVLTKNALDDSVFTENVRDCDTTLRTDRCI